MAERRLITDEEKAGVLADFNLGMSKSAIARKYGMGRTTVIGIIGDHESPVPTVSDAQKKDLGELVYEYLVAGLEGLISQARVMGNPEWFKEQGEFAHLIHGTLADKLVIIFGGVERGRANAQPGPDTPGAQEPR